ncbi:YheC/YheD family protein [Pseudalkalibacillus hwajinpoensis]|uniref:YheC/YheD family endospore coat-associated protein n=1 Tax=Guptibacillus hwajinpoensis TaxID=208199 RepID=UPI00325AF177
MKLAEKVILQPVNENNTLRILSIPEKIAAKWNLTSSTTLFRYMDLEEVITIQVYPSPSSHTVYCSPSLLTTLNLPYQTIPLVLTYCHQEQILSFGPIFCLVTNTTGDETSPFGAYTAFCREVADYCENHHILFYVYTFKTWGKDSVTGRIWNQREWVEWNLPKPSMIYNRIHSRKLEQSQSIQKLKALWKEQRIPYFNESFLNKWEVHERLLSHEEIAPYLPDTVLLESIDTIQAMLTKYQTLYLKPLNGSQGKHIFRISYMNALYHLDYSSFNGNQTVSSPTLTGLYPAIRARSKHVPYLVQQGIPLHKINDCPVDFRILCLKGTGEKWQVVSAVARIAESRDQFVSNVARGAQLKRFEEGLVQFEEGIQKQTKRILPELAREVSQIIDLETEGFFGELGIDLSVDQNGHPWIIEVNTKPSKTFEGITNNTYRPSVKALIRFITWCTSS